MKREKKCSSTYTDFDRLSLLKKYYESGLPKLTFSKQHGISPAALNNWLLRYGVSDLVSVIPLIEKLNMPSDIESLQSELEQLKKEKKLLEKELQNSHFRNEALSLMIDLAESTYKIGIRKNSDAK